MITKLKLKSLLWAFSLSGTAFAIDVVNFNNPVGQTYTLTEDMNATGNDATNYGTFVVDGTNITITTENNIANRNGEGYFKVSEGSSVTVLPNLGFWNENFFGEGSGIIELLANSSMTIGSVEKTADFNNHNDALVKINSNATLAVLGNINNINSARIQVNGGSIDNSNGHSYFRDSSTLELTNASYRAKSLYNEANAKFNFANATVYTRDDMRNNGTLNVNSTSSIIFGTNGRAFFNETSGTVNIKAGESLNISRVREGSDDSFFCNYGKIIVEANTSIDDTDPIISVKNFVDDGNAGIIALDFSNVSGSYENVGYTIIQAQDALSIGATTFQYTLDGITFKTISLGDEIEDGNLTLTLLKGNRDISYMYSMIPEPETYAAIFAAFSFAFVCYRRRKSR